MSTDTSAVILIPLSVTDAMMAAGTSIPAVDTSMGEAAWAAGTAYSAGQRVNHGGSIWESVASSTGVTPGTDGAKWLRAGPSNRMAPFDDELNTRAVATGSMTYVLRPGFFTGLALWGLQGDHLTVRIYEQPGGPVVEEYDADLYDQDDVEAEEAMKDKAFHNQCSPSGHVTQINCPVFVCSFNYGADLLQENAGSLAENNAFVVQLRGAGKPVQQTVIGPVVDHVASCQQGAQQGLAWLKTVEPQM